MTDSSQAPREARIGHANQPAVPSSAEWATAGLVSRKGRLHLLLLREVDQTLIAEVYRRYYTDPCFDVLPALRAALAAVHDGVVEARETIPLAVVVQGLEFYAVGTAESALWLIRAEEVKDLTRGARNLEPERSGYETKLGRPPLYATQNRLYTGDTLVITTREAGARLAPQALRRAVHPGNTPDAMAGAVARRAQDRAHPRIPVMVIHMPGFTPMPEMGPAVKLSMPRTPPVRPPKPRGETSPIWPALLLAVIALSIALWVKRPALSRENVNAVVMWLITPRATGSITVVAGAPGQSVAVALQATPSSGAVGAPSTKTQPTVVPSVSATARREATRQPTAKPTATRRPTQRPTLSPTVATYPTPQLVSPQKGEGVHDPYVTLKWTWGGTLGPDEYYDVRAWRLGTDKRSIAWTKEPTYIERNLEAGWHLWTVVVVRGKDGMIEQELSAEPEPVAFNWPGGSEGRADTATPRPTTAPTRVTPVAQPTGAPGSGE